jgi:uncharacterized membrane protein
MLLFGALSLNFGISLIWEGDFSGFIFAGVGLVILYLGIRGLWRVAKDVFGKH